MIEDVPLPWWIIGATALVVIGLWVIDRRHHKRFDKIDRDHELLHKDLKEEQRLAASTRDNSWYQFNTIRMHLMKLLSWEKK